MSYDNNILFNDDVCIGLENDDFSAYFKDESEEANNKKETSTEKDCIDVEQEPENNEAAPDEPSEPRSRYTWRRGGPGGPLFTPKPSKYNPISMLLGCGVPKQSLRGLPRALLQHMEPRFCGVCNMKLQCDNSTRLHYISKTHAKRQKMWLTQQADLGSHPPIETALKARELYCELCDVHITSTNHADSHYSGKAHRGVVEGRREPKNRYLLQRDMENRLNFLIRREKKYLRSMEANDKAKTMKPAKQVVGPDIELSCKICKITVTCFDQMTSHMNGKKHLSKEKQHILKMMRLKSVPDDADKTSNTDNASKDAGTQQPGGDDGSLNDRETQAQYECEYGDWVDGDGIWED